MITISEYLISVKIIAVICLPFFTQEAGLACLVLFKKTGKNTKRSKDLS